MTLHPGPAPRERDAQHRTALHYVMYFLFCGWR